MCKRPVHVRHADELRFIKQLNYKDASTMKVIRSHRATVDVGHSIILYPGIRTARQLQRAASASSASALDRLYWQCRRSSETGSQRPLPAIAGAHRQSRAFAGPTLANRLAPATNSYRGANDRLPVRGNWKRESGWCRVRLAAITTIKGELRSAVIARQSDGTRM
jgi:hypothetical protein